MRNLIKNIASTIGYNYRVICFIMCSFIFLLTASGLIIRYAGQTTEGIAQNVIRFHVVANSDSVEDQILKQQVRDEVIQYMQPILADSKDVYETKQKIRDNLKEINTVADKVVAAYEKDYPVWVTLDRSNFPTKSYGDVLFPAGEYEACRIIIGDGKGENWWCVMFPPLCYIDATSGVVPLEGKEELEKELTEEQYNLVMSDSNKDKYQIRFKIVDTVNSLLKKSNYQEPSSM